MTTKQYLTALKKLGLTPSSKTTAETLGLGLRQCQRIAVGAPIPGPVERLLALLIERKEQCPTSSPISASARSAKADPA